MTVGCSGRAALRREQCDMTPESRNSAAKKEDRSWAIAWWARSHGNNYIRYSRIIVEHGVFYALLVSNTQYVVKEK
jgi:hypothetical protein